MSYFIGSFRKLCMIIECKLNDNEYSFVSIDDGDCSFEKVFCKLIF